MGWNPFGRKAKKEASVPIETIRRLEQIRDLYMESAKIMGSTKNLTTFLSRYEDARRFISGFNSIMVQAGQAPIPEMNDDIDALFVGRVSEVVSEEVAAAQGLKTVSGRQDRLQRVVDALERVDRPDEGPVDDAILEAEDIAFRAIGKTVDWASEPSDSDISVSEDQILKS